ncbi:hypothetical protein HPB50_016385 [Hyalomma asiaticum]|uniref:Uncharacterized protein n=1 Tax=Hyalomma asiaticum TaxID=266040 RepID=A0ACB7SYN5_HYAAI|nr:hypothetical protein HPB50_016385 [Hyalomma asiaticum]
MCVRNSIVPLPARHRLSKAGSAEVDAQTPEKPETMLRKVPHFGALGLALCARNCGELTAHRRLALKCWNVACGGVVGGVSTMRCPYLVMSEGT